MDARKLSGKVALVTGAARGLGRGYALHLAGLGANVAIIDRNLAAADVYEFEKALMTAETVVAECEALGVRAIGLEVDLTDREATTEAVATVVRELGRIDIAVCNAGGGTVVFADELPDDAEAVMDQNTTGTPSDTPQEALTRVWRRT